MWRDSIGTNIAAGVVAAMVAIPLNLALAVACDLPPTAGLVSGAIGGLIVAFFGGTRLNITGPEVALAPLTAVIVAAHGIDGMLIATAIAGLVQIALGLLRVGAFVRLLPRPVVGGFLAAVGVMVFDSQVPHLLGVHDGRRVVNVAAEISDFALHGTSIAIGLAVVLVLILVPRVTSRVPAPLVALAFAIGVVAFLELSVERVAPLEGSALMLRLPDLGAADLLAILPSALALAALASLDSLLCAVSIDARMGTRHRPDQELIAQGVANVACSMVGGMPVAAAVVRSVTAIEARGTTRLCGVVQSIVLLFVLLALGSHLDLVPLSALAGVLLVVGAKLIQVRELANVWRVRRFEAFVFVATAIAIVWTGFVEGLLIGAALAMLELTRSQASALAIRTRFEGTTCVIRVDGPLVFASQQRATDLLSAEMADVRSLVLELHGVTHWDASGVAALRTALAPLHASGARIEIVPGPIPTDALAQDLGRIATLRGSSHTTTQASVAQDSVATMALEGAE
jgi:SulP family sulfate permease